MQAVFEAANNTRVISAISEEILHCISEEIPIIFLEYNQSGDTLPQLLSLVRGYPHVFRTTKNQDDGSKEVAAVLKKNKLPHKTVRVCGVNADACVERTISGLCRKYPRTEIIVVKNACGTCGGPGHYDWNCYITRRNLKLV